MQIIFNSLYRMQKNGETVVNPAPVDSDTPKAPWLSEQAVALAPKFAASGFTGWLWPPLTMSQGGSAPNADGYGKQYDLNVGQWNRTRWGLATQVLEANEALHAAGLFVLEDAVIHQYDGGNSQHYYELGSNGKQDKTLFPKFPSCFAPTSPVDPVFDPNGNAWDGDLAVYVNSTPKGYMLSGMLSALNWRRRALALDGRRIDEAKGEAISTVKAIAAEVGGINFCEAYTAGPELTNYVDQAGLPALDFGFHFAAKAACEGGSFYNWVNSGLWMQRPGLAWLFADTGDTDLNNGTNIRFNKLWAYAFGLNVSAAAMLIYSADYLPEHYGLQKFLDNLVWFSRTFAFGPTTFPWMDDTFIVLSRNGDGGEFGWSGGCMVAINADPINARGEWVKTPFRPGTRLHNYAPTFGADTWVNADGWAYIEAGPNAFGSGQSYSLWAEAGVEYEIPHPALPHKVETSLTDFTGVVRYTAA